MACAQKDPYNYDKALYDWYGELITSALLKHGIPAIEACARVDNPELAFFDEFTQRLVKHHHLTLGMVAMFHDLDTCHTWPRCDSVIHL